VNDLPVLVLKLLVLLVGCAFLCAGATTAGTFLGSAFSARADCELPRGWSFLTITPGMPGEPLEATDSVLSIASAPDQPSVIYAGGSRGLYRSRDCGARWEQVPISMSRSDIRPSQFVWSVAVGPGGYLYVATGSAVLVSRDEGANWHGSSTTPSRPLVASATDQRVAYAVVLGRFETPDHLRRTEDGGVTWESFPGSRRVPLAYALAVDASDPDLLYLPQPNCQRTALCYLYRMPSISTATEPVALFAEPITALTTSADGSTFWLSTSDGTLYRSLDGAAHFEAIAHVPDERPITALAANPVDPNHVYLVLGQAEPWSYRHDSHSSIGQQQQSAGLEG
jgi:hypothetical protein